ATATCCARSSSTAPPSDADGFARGGSPMTAVLWALRRIVVAALTVLAVGVLIFTSVRLMPGSYIDVALGPLATDEQRAASIGEAGLDQPVIVQFLQWISGIVTGDLGRSFVSDVSIAGEFALRLPVTAT